MSKPVQYTANKAKEIAGEDFAKAKELARSAAVSGSYLYPFKGIFYLATHRSLWQPLLSRLAPTMTLSAIVVSVMFTVAYLPQMIVLSLVNGPIAAVTTVLLTLSESSTIITLLSRQFLIRDALVDTFDGTLLARNQSAIVAEGRVIQPGGDPIAKLGKMIKRPFQNFTPKAIIRYILYLPLNFIPVVGTGLFLLLQGRNRGYSVHTRYFQLKGWSKSQRDEYVKDHLGPYSGFGTVATLLELVPLASILFSFTNTVGAALWAADLEQHFREVRMTTDKDNAEQSH